VRRINGDGLELAVSVSGEGTPVLLLHGFPDSSRLWRNQLPALHDQGFLTIAPDLRGFGESGKPADVSEYRVGRSVADLVAILDALEIPKAHVVGHDWGAGVAWMLAMAAPERVEKLVAMSVGHPGTRARRTLEDRQRAWYMLLFQFEEAEELLTRDDWALTREWASSHPDLEAVLAGFELTPGLNWYRANLHPARELAPPRELPPVEADTLGLWSDGDIYLTERQMAESAEFVPRFRYERIERASHWMQLDAGERVNALILSHLCNLQSS
jgi:pimeloyl-ACP methyl ester carboxylesterase